MQNNIIKKNAPVTERKVVLLDGRIVTVPLFSSFRLVNHDQLKIKLNFNIFSNKEELHVALSNIILVMWFR